MGCGLLVVALLPGTAAALITGSGHDLAGTAAGTNGGDQICIYCHTPHNANTVIADAPLWNHQVDTGAAYIAYGDPAGTMDATAGTPSGISALCMSCHDGQIGVDNYGGFTPGTLIGTISSVADFGLDLSNDHPISFVYDTNLANTDAELWDPAVDTVSVGTGGTTQSGTIAAVLLFNDKVECASCHDVHNTQISSENYKLVRDNMVGSELCLDCHNK
ncbi:MAG: hypothetical protein A2W28_00060 [Gammaproteobacteria bacterium RBG_16_51_14]|nr:MAG: hypothetical protein A2W28_00060 [Gammaproteobacteria bacterium RBG_16_51_14]